MHGGKFAFQNRLRYVACSGKEINLPCLLCFTLYSRANSKYKPPGGLYSEGRFNGGFLRYDFGGLIFGGAYAWRGLFSGILRWSIPKNRTNDRIGPISSFLKTN